MRLDERDFCIVREHRRGESYASIARRYGLSRERVRQICRWRSRRLYGQAELDIQNWLLVLRWSPLIREMVERESQGSR